MPSPRQTGYPNAPSSPSLGSVAQLFFANERAQLFRPLTGKYREQVVACLRGLYGQLYTTLADYSRSLAREQVIELFQEMLTRTPLLDGDDEPGPRSEREQANWVLNLLLEHGWLERHLDEATLQGSYGFSRVGRLFTQPLVETSGSRFRTRHRNTRHTRNALEAFLEKGEVYDLLDAYEYSERIVADFSDIIAELDERKRQLVREVEAQQVVQRASEEFFDFMEKRFMPDLAIRLSADSVEKYRDEIAALTQRARRQRREFKAQAERELRRSAPELILAASSSVYLAILDGIEARVQSASEVMLPALRQALHGFTRRADIIIRQISYSDAGRGELIEACQVLNGLDDSEFDRRLALAGERLASLQVGFPDPDALRLLTGQRRRVVNTAVEPEGGDHPEARRALFIQAALDRAFTVNQRELRDYLLQALSAGRSLNSSELPVNDARQLLHAAHAIEAAAAAGDEGPFRLVITPTGRRLSGPYFKEADEFRIELLESGT